MRYFLVAAAFAAVAASAPANALENYGPVRVGNQCVTPAPTFAGRDMTWASWSTCPQPASANVAPAPKKKKHQ